MEFMRSLKPIAILSALPHASLTCGQLDANRRKIYEQLFNEGVMVAKKDFHAPQHPELDGIPNLHVIKALQSLKSKGYVTEQFAWRHYYWYLKNEGTEYLRDYLHLPAEIVPATWHRQARAETARPARAGPRGEAKGAEDRSAYRRGDGDKKGDVGVGGGNVEFRGGYGRGAPRGGSGAAPPPAE
ncbi:unnamed protein product [Allacma fusca]|uniref:Plectin/eS10 N-terminal domain-containing protein n=1 Tax=Allacma fusca TaxID=39272 RepID=A0A8J2K2C6_9HEXA|nr:unnamed protein product [Allacma fusca]